MRPRFARTGRGGPRFVLDVLPDPRTTPRGSVLCVQPFADEANLSRRVLVAQARRLAAQGWRVSIPDLYGTGDSAGEDEEATLDIWRHDLDSVAGWLEEGASERGIVIWGTRLGCLLASDLLRRRARAADVLVLWQPGQDGASLLGPLLRLDKAAALTRVGGDVERRFGAAPAGSETAADPDILAMAGYRFRRDLIDQLAAMTCAPPGSPPAHAMPDLPRSGPKSSAPAWRAALLLMMSRRATAAPGASAGATGGLTRQWQAAGGEVREESVAAEPFWSSMEPSEPTRAFLATEAFLAAL